MHLTTELKRAMLARMGIDVWVDRRPAAAEAPRVPAEGTRRSSGEQAPQAPADTPRAPAKQTGAPETTFAAVRNSGATPVEARLQATSPRVWTAISAGAVVFIGEIVAPQHRRLAQDVVLAAAGFPQEAAVAVSFEDAVRGADGGASSAVLAFVRGQLDRRRAQLLIVTSAAVPVLGLGVAGPAGQPRWMEIYGVRCLEIGDLEQLRLRPERKRDLWRALSQSR